MPTPSTDLSPACAVTLALASRNRRDRHLPSFVRSAGGFAAPEVALLALLFIGIAIMVGNKLIPAMKTAASCLNTELAGGLPCKK